MEFLAFVREDLVSILLSAGHALQLSKVFSAWQLVLEFLVPLLVILEFNTYLLHAISPLLLKHVILL